MVNDTPIEEEIIMKKTGFTLIELLIVIALLGALAIGLIGAIDPFEQLKKGQDTATRNTVSEIHSSIIRYYALKGRMPWCPTGTCPPANYPVTDLSGMYTAAASDTIAGSLSNIIATGELKSNFPVLQSQQLDKVYVSGDDANATVCFLPASKSFRTDNNSVYTLSGTAGPVGCPKSTLSCYWCVQ
jgi:prepilin-type N-terminal cleavage/methylation domain-containing protein